MKLIAGTTQCLFFVKHLQSLFSQDWSSAKLPKPVLIYANLPKFCLRFYLLCTNIKIICPNFVRFLPENHRTRKSLPNVTDLKKKKSLRAKVLKFFSSTHFDKKIRSLRRRPKKVVSDRIHSTAAERCPKVRDQESLPNYQNLSFAVKKK